MIVVTCVACCVVIVAVVVCVDVVAVVVIGIVGVVVVASGIAVVVACVSVIVLLWYTCMVVLHICEFGRVGGLCSSHPSLYTHIPLPAAIHFLRHDVLSLHHHIYVCIIVLFVVVGFAGVVCSYIGSDVVGV